MKIAIIGQKWLGSEVLAAARAFGAVEYVIAPSPEDRLAQAAHISGTDVFICAGAIGDLYELPAVDLLVSAHSFLYVPAWLRASAAWSVGYHPSLLPLHKGRHAVERAISAGDRVTGGTVYRLEDGMDDGAVVYQDWCFVEPGETAATLWRRTLAPMGLELLTKTMWHLAEHGFLNTTPQACLRPLTATPADRAA